MLGTYSFEPQTQDDLHKSFQELDDSGTGYVPIAEMRKYLTSLGEGLSSDEVDIFMDLCDKETKPGYIDIRQVSEVLLPKLQTTNLLQAPSQNVSQDEIQNVSAAAIETSQD